MTMTRTLCDNERASISAQQREERDAMAAIFAEDFIPLSSERDDALDYNSAADSADEGVISYAIRLVGKPLTSSSVPSRPRCCLDAEVEDAHDKTTTSLNNDNHIETDAIAITASTNKNYICHQLPQTLPPNHELALAITYPPDYPLHSLPLFHVHYCNPGKFAKLHSIQEEAILNCASKAVALSSSSSWQNHGDVAVGIPCAYDCVLAVKEFIQRGGIDQACMLFALLSSRGEDCLAHILTYLISSTQDIDAICTSLPLIFCNDGSSVVKSNVIWRELCARRWRTRWGFQERWRKYAHAFRTRMQQPFTTSTSSSLATRSKTITTITQFHCDTQYFWMHAYNYEETDALRTYLTRMELHSMTFDYRTWFSISSLRNQPENMRDVLPSGLRTCLAKDVIFLQEETPAITSSSKSRLSSSSPGGLISSSNVELSKLVWEGMMNNDTRHCTENTHTIHDGGDQYDHTEAILGIYLKRPSSSTSAELESLVVGRCPNWGWELRGPNSVFRALDDGDNDDNCHPEREAEAEKDNNDSERRLSWEDLTTNMIIQERPRWITTNCRTHWETNYREIPDDEDCKMLDW